MRNNERRITITNRKMEGKDLEEKTEKSMYKTNIGEIYYFMIMEDVKITTYE